MIHGYEQGMCIPAENDADGIRDGWSRALRTEAQAIQTWTRTWLIFSPNVLNPPPNARNPQSLRKVQMSCATKWRPGCRRFQDGSPETRWQGYKEKVFGWTLEVPSSGIRREGMNHGSETCLWTALCFSFPLEFSTRPSCCQNGIRVCQRAKVSSFSSSMSSLG